MSIPLEKIEIISLLTTEGSIPFERIEIKRVDDCGKEYIYKMYHQDPVTKKRIGYYNKWHAPNLCDSPLWKEKNYNPKEPGVLHGKFETRARYGRTLEEGSYKNGKLDGEYKSWDDRGEPNDNSNWKDGKKHGKYIKWRCGSKEESLWDEGKFIESRTWYKDGQKEEERLYNRDAGYMERQTWWRNGNKQSKYCLNGNVRVGKIKRWNEYGIRILD